MAETTSFREAWLSLLLKEVTQVEHQNRIAEAIRRKQLAAAEALAAQIADVAVTIRREAGDDDKPSVL